MSARFKGTFLGGGAETIEEADARLDQRQRDLDSWAKALSIVQYVISRDEMTRSTHLHVELKDRAMLMEPWNPAEWGDALAWEWVS